MKKHLHIVTFNVPYPPDYGGVIDVFYKLKALSEQGTSITLHAFEYGRPQAVTLERYCEKVYYYTRETGVRSQLSLIPYIVYSRRNQTLLENLQKDDSPILFEGLHTCYYLSHPSLRNRCKIVRLHNIEHIYYRGLAACTRSLWKKIYFALEALRLKRYEKQLRNAEYLLPLSSTETVYFEQHYGKEKVKLVPLFFQREKNDENTRNILPCVLYQGDLSTPENIRAATHLIRALAAPDSTIPWLFAGKNPD
ncbi:MAG: glycosyltransferase family 1 protein, partial [Dysgonamonadaceae bacterium]|nr:glycosyltransferase family 1 protein [Dysgonamonadaceae bacterium]